jgi:hypothetical protein
MNRPATPLPLTVAVGNRLMSAMGRSPAGGFDVPKRFTPLMPWIQKISFSFQGVDRGE